jgi:hypothetical protein
MKWARCLVANTCKGTGTPSLTPIASIFFFNEPLTRGTSGPSPLNFLLSFPCRAETTVLVLAAQDI